MAMNSRMKSKLNWKYFFPFILHCVSVNVLRREAVWTLEGRMVDKQSTVSNLWFLYYRNPSQTIRGLLNFPTKKTKRSLYELSIPKSWDNLPLKHSRAWYKSRFDRQIFIADNDDLSVSPVVDRRVVAATRMRILNQTRN